jgi:hypothetical protein
VIVPGYWQSETSGDLRPSVERYLVGTQLSTRDIALLRNYIRQWICSPVWDGHEEVSALREMVDSLTSRAQIDLWTERALDIGIDLW